MKAIINGIEFEGSPLEFGQLISFVKVQESLSKPELSLTKTVKTVSSKQVSEKKQINSFSDSVEFITALYRYKPSRNRNRQGYALQLLVSGKVFTIRALAERANTDVVSIVSAIRRAVAADCVIEVSNRDSSNSTDLNQDTKIRLVSLGTVERALAVKHDFHAKAAKEFLSKKKPKLMSTGSAPITKIIYTENN